MRTEGVFPQAVSSTSSDRPCRSDSVNGEGMAKWMVKDMLGDHNSDLDLIPCPFDTDADEGGFSPR